MSTPATPLPQTEAPANGYPDSWYARSTPALPKQPRLQGVEQVDVCILGAGYTGLTAALALAEAGYKVIVLEARRVGWGASGRNGGQAIVGYGCEQQTLEALVGNDDARLLFDFSRDGMRLLRARIERHAIACDWRDGHAHVPLKQRHVQALQHGIVRMAERYDYPLEWWDRTRTRQVLDSPLYLGAMFDPASGHLHPLAYALGLARAALAAGVRIHEDSAVTRLQDGTPVVMHTAQGSVAADFGVIAGNALLQGIAAPLEQRIMPVGTYVGATPPLGESCARALIANDMAVADTNWALDYYRLSADHRLLFGGRASYSSRPPHGLDRLMTRRMHSVFPQLHEVPLETLWGGYVDISRNRAPHWGRLASNVYFAQGFSGHGVAATGLAGHVIAEAISGQSRRLDVFERIPHRSFPGGRRLRTPLLVAAMSWYRLRDALW
ncbi:oxidoreductase [Xanthomonas fragariae]|uniref:Oxidoreductase n=4 Tax=Xanthomonas fragariae TaxID=48664 RepID=A0A1Y6H6T2_9XANT|nr:FAD-binding oxidoreductase [Xanthomonas fragariae]ENZ94860.1 gamma-glutamylputrescine oxidoreductase [Xanthomonas fragariae LMG 25863]AOD14611.1 FAD-dependent oxidoreductase [Xanthomonas fragariae]AOD18007.1 FAD-dependent oxidoreductase [Xanthomonas fragariae]SMQ94942.1 oxidoreductase [Xanthomonas fragariae]SMQ98836.1 Gamma-glutamylputrescine oxidoreductase [Xanthomonas fragariae]